jgi:plastocyanin
MLRRAFVLVIISALIGCSGSKKNADKEEYPDFNEEGKKVTSSPVDSSSAALKNTETFHTVEIKQMKFVPDVLHLKAGDTVLWINEDITDHDVTEEANKAWSSSKLSPGQSWKKVFTKSEDYYCSIHVVMKGKLVLE